MVRYTDVTSGSLNPIDVGSSPERAGSLTSLSRVFAALSVAIFALGIPEMSQAQQQAPSARSGQVAQPGQTYTVRPGDTLDRIISESLGQTPFNQNFLREAFAQLNPKALPQGPRGPLMAGATLRIPDAAGLRRLAFPGEASDTRAVAPVKPAGDTGDYVPDVRQSWIRFP